MKALKYHGGVEKDKIKEENIEALEVGMHNLLRHVDNLKNKFGLNVIVAINKYVDDSQKEISLLQEKLREKGICLSLVEAWEHGGKGAQDLAQKIVELTDKETNLHYVYELEESIKTKIEKIAKNIYGAEGVEYSEEAEEEIAKIEKLGYGKFPVCMAKTQYSFSDDPKNLICDKPFTIHVQEIRLKTGAEFIVVLTGKIFTMPGLPKVPAAESIDIDEKGNVVGIF